MHPICMLLGQNATFSQLFFVWRPLSMQLSHEALEITHESPAQANCSPWKFYILASFPQLFRGWLQTEQIST